MATAVGTKWKYKAEYLELCNCAYGCPCNFNGFPTHGACRGVIAMRITEGTSGKVDLAGAVIAMAVSWPKAIHDGNGTAAVFFDPSTTAEQQAELVAIFTNQYGGLPHEILATTLTDIKGPFVEPIDIKVDGTRSSVRIGSKLSAEMTPHVSPMDASVEQRVNVVVPDGFIFQEANAARAVGVSVNVDGLAFQEADTNAFFAVVEHGN